MASQDQIVVDNCACFIDLKRAVFSEKSVAVNDKFHHLDDEQVQQFCCRMIQDLFDKEKIDQNIIKNICALVTRLPPRRICVVWNFIMSSCKFPKTPAHRNYNLIKMFYPMLSKPVTTYLMSPEGHRFFSTDEGKEMLSKNREICCDHDNS